MSYCRLCLQREALQFRHPTYPTCEPCTAYVQSIPIERSRALFKLADRYVAARGDADR